MKKHIITGIVGLMLITSSVLAVPVTNVAVSQVSVYLEENSKTNALRDESVSLLSDMDGIRIIKWDVDGVPYPDYTNLQDVATCEILYALPASSKKIVNGRLVAKTPAEREADDLALNGGVYTYKNAFLLLCDQASGGHTQTKLSFEQITPLLRTMKKGGAVQKEKFQDLRDAFNTVNQALIKKDGINWWDNCNWNTNPIIINNAILIYNTLMD